MRISRAGRGSMLFALLCAAAFGAYRWRVNSTQPLSTTFFRIPLGTGERELAPDAVSTMYQSSRFISETGILDIDDNLNGTIIDYRYLGGQKGPANRILFFNKQGLSDKVITVERGGNSNPLAPQIALGPDNTIWTALTLYSDRPYFSLRFLRKYDKSGSILLQLGDDSMPRRYREPSSPEFRRMFTARYNHRWGEAYDFQNKIHGLWTDRKGRVYVLTEGTGFHIFSGDGTPLAAFDLTGGKLNLKGDLGTLGITVMHVDSEGRIYGTKHLSSSVEPGVTNYVVEVLKWENGVRTVFSAPMPGGGVVLGSDGKGNIYYMNQGHLNNLEDRIYKLGPDKQAQLFFQPEEYYRSWIKSERRVWLARQTEEIQKIARDGWKSGKTRNLGPRVGHVTKIDKNGSFYLTLVGANEFRIDKISFK